jgi:hypothetical protein
MIVAIVFIGVVGGVLSTAFKNLGDRKVGKAARAEAQREADELREQIVTLEDRIRVLERIVTDTSKRDDLHRQFRDLER